MGGLYLLTILSNAAGDSGVPVSLSSKVFISLGCTDTLVKPQGLGPRWPCHGAPGPRMPRVYLGRDFLLSAPLS